MRYHLGNPDTFGMLALPPVARGATMQLSRSDSTLRLGSGGTALTRVAETKVQGALQFDPVDRDADASWAMVRDLYRGVYGAGPYVLVDPNNTNHLDLPTSLMGAWRGMQPWSPSTGGTVTQLAEADRPDRRAGALAWQPVAGADGLLVPGSIAAAGATAGQVPTGAPCVPYLPSRAARLSMVLWASAPATVALRLARRTVPTTSTIGEFVGANFGITTVPVRYQLDMPAGAMGAGAFGYILPGLWVRNAAAGLVIRCTMPQVEYPLSLPSALRGWQPGAGCPRVSITDGPRTQQRLHRQRDFSLTLAEK